MGEPRTTRRFTHTLCDDHRSQIYTHTHTHTCTHTNTHTYTRTDIHTCTHTQVHTTHTQERTLRKTLIVSMFFVLVSFFKLTFTGSVGCSFSIWLEGVVILSLFCLLLNLDLSGSPWVAHCKLQSPNNKDLVTCHCHIL